MASGLEPKIVDFCLPHGKPRFTSFPSPSSSSSWDILPFIIVWVGKPLDINPEGILLQKLWITYKSGCPLFQYDSFLP